MLSWQCQGRLLLCAKVTDELLPCRPLLVPIHALSLLMLRAWPAFSKGDWGPSVHLDCRLAVIRTGKGLIIVHDGISFLGLLDKVDDPMWNIQIARMLELPDLYRRIYDQPFHSPALEQEEANRCVPLYPCLRCTGELGGRSLQARIGLG